MIRCVTELGIQFGRCWRGYRFYTTNLELRLASALLTPLPDGVLRLYLKSPTLAVLSCLHNVQKNKANKQSHGMSRLSAFPLNVSVCIFWPLFFIG